VAADVVDLLAHGSLSIEGRLVDASNTTLRAELSLDGMSARCVYKPVRGERPLWDFPEGTLAGREFAAYLVSEATGWGIVPPTVLRDGPLGPGMCQLWIDEERQRDEPLVDFVPGRRIPPGWHRVAAARDENGRPYVLAHAGVPQLARMAVYDAVINNADRKGGHILSTVDGQVHGVDHGVSFHVEDKLRTVLWGWAGRPLPPAESEVLARVGRDLGGELGDRLGGLISEEEVAATVARIDRLLAAGLFPEPVPGWPAMPWPPI